MKFPIVENALAFCVITLYISWFTRNC